MGPRSREWLEATDRDPRTGADFFPWWNRGFGASYLCGRALVDLWTRIPWSPPIDDEEERTMRATLALLRAAHEAEPERALPWRAWAELAELVDPPEVLPQDAAANAENDDSGAIGYRRHRVIAALPDGWSVRIPGSFVTRFEDAMWSAYEDGDRSANVTVWNVPPGAEPPPSPGDEHRDDRDGVRRVAWTRMDESEDGPFVMLTGFAIAGESAAHVTATAEAGGEEWALDVWRALSRSS